MMLDLDSSIKKKKGAKYFELDEDLDQDWIKEHQEFLVEEQRQKIIKKFEKENEKLAAEGGTEMKAKELDERLSVLKDLQKKFQKENKTRKVEVEGKGQTIEKLENNITKLEQRIENMSLQAEDKENNKEVALGTSKIVSLHQCGFEYDGQWLTESYRIISTHVSPWSSRKNSMCPSRSSSPRRSARSSTGLSSPWRRIGSFRCD
jgi:type II secretory pathway component GspD/PulD (secretin)